MERTILKWVGIADIWAARLKALWEGVKVFGFWTVFTTGALMLMSVAGLAVWARIDEKRMRKRGRTWTGCGRR